MTPRAAPRCKVQYKGFIGESIEADDGARFSRVWMASVRQMFASLLEAVVGDLLLALVMGLGQGMKEECPV